LAQAGTGLEHQSLRIVVTRGGRRLLLTEPLTPYRGSVRLCSMTYAPTRVLDGVKSLSYGANMLCSRLAQEQGFDEALLVTPHGRVLEAPTSSLFWVTSSGAVLTPPLDDHILASITRAIVIDESGAREQVCTMDDLAAASEAFLASTIREVQPIAAIDSLEFRVDGPVTASCAERFTARVEAELGGS
jgi:branched-chain amino acid aminotransferase